jgi:hypothetical protein
MRTFPTILLLVVLAAPVQAALVDNGSFTTDTASGLDWLDLSATGDLSMADALAANLDWRFATNSEVEGIFNQLFDGYYDTSTTSVDVSAYTGLHYEDQVVDILNFQSLFGNSYHNVDGSFIYGLYADEDDVIRFTGARISDDHSVHYIFGLDHQNFYTSDPIFPNFSTFLVRSSVVPIPAAVWLFGSALAGLGWMRRKQTV